MDGLVATLGEQGPWGLFVGILLVFIGWLWRAREKDRGEYAEELRRNRQALQRFQDAIILELQALRNELRIEERLRQIGRTNWTHEMKAFVAGERGNDVAD